jgi:hypothetical protein
MDYPSAVMAKTPKFSLPWVEHEIERHKAAIADLEAMGRVIRSSGPRPVPPAPPEPAPSPTANGSTNGAHLDAAAPPVVARYIPRGVQPSNKRTLLGLIASAPQGLTTRQVIEAAPALGLPNRNISNVSPHLSGWHREKGLLSLNKGVWSITQAGRDFLASDKN